MYAGSQTGRTIANKTGEPKLPTHTHHKLGAQKNAIERACAQWLFSGCETCPLNFASGILA